MSEFIPIDLPVTVANTLKRASRMLLQDLQALPEDAFDRKFGEKTRTVADIVHEVNLTQDHICLKIRGETAFDWPEELIVAPGNQRTKDTVIAAFEKSSGLVLEAVAGLSYQDLERRIVNEPGEQGERNVFDWCHHMMFHLWYHSGQLNLIQRMLGDDGWHWD